MRPAVGPRPVPEVHAASPALRPERGSRAAGAARLGAPAPGRGATGAGS